MQANFPKVDYLLQYLQNDNTEEENCSLWTAISWKRKNVESSNLVRMHLGSSLHFGQQWKTWLEYPFKVVVNIKIIFEVMFKVEQNSALIGQVQGKFKVNWWLMRVQDFLTWEVSIWQV